MKVTMPQCIILDILDKTGGNLAGLEAEIGKRLAEFRDAFGVGLGG